MGMRSTIQLAASNNIGNLPPSPSQPFFGAATLVSSECIDMFVKWMQASNRNVQFTGLNATIYKPIPTSHLLALRTQGETDVQYFCQDNRWTCNYNYNRFRSAGKCRQAS